MLSAFIEQHKLPKEFTQTVAEHYMPLASRIFEQFKRHKGTYFIGVNGCQGSGKTTFTAFIAKYLQAEYQLNVLVMSLDDFYLTSEKRKKLALDVHPLLATRGVPGTHDVIKLNKVLKKLRDRKRGITIPKFNKAIDDPFPKEQWLMIERPVDIVLLEGWCWGVSAQTERQLQQPINSLESRCDNKLQWRTFINEQLANNYMPLYKQMDFWIALQAPSFDCVHQWRLEQEQKLSQMSVNDENFAIMDSPKIIHFIQHFQRLTVHAIKTLPNMVNVTLFLDRSRAITHTRENK